MKEIYPAKTISYIVIFYIALNVQLAGRLLKVRYPKFTVMRGVEHTVLLIFSDVSKIPIINQMIYAHNMIFKSNYLCPQDYT